MNEFVIEGMPYGLANKGNTTMLSKYEMSDCLNIDLNKTGLPSTRGGSSVLYSEPIEAGKPVEGGVEFIDYDQITHILVACNGKLYYDQSVDTDTDLIGWKRIGEGLTLAIGKHIQYNFTRAVLNNYQSMIIGTEDNNPLFYWEGKVDGTYSEALPIEGEIECARTIEWFNNYLLVGNYVNEGKRYRSRMCWSDLRNPLSINANRDIFIGSADDPIMHMTKALKYIAILKENSLWRLRINDQNVGAYTPADVDYVPFILEHVAEGIGTSSPNGVTVYENFVYFQGKDGRYRWDVRGIDDDAIQKLDVKIDDDPLDWDQIKDVYVVAYPRKEQVRFFCAEEWEDKMAKEKSYFYSCHPHLLDPRTTPQLPAWTRNKLKLNSVWTGRDYINRTRLPVELPMVFGDTDNTPYLFGGTYDGYVVKLDLPWYHDSDQAYQSFVETGDLNCRSSRRKSFNQMHLTVQTPNWQGCNLETTQYTNFGNVVSATGTQDCTNSGESKTIDMILGGNDRYTRFRFETNSASEGFRLNSLIIGYDPSR